MSAALSVSDETTAPMASALVRAGWSGSSRRIALPYGTASGPVIPPMDRLTFVGTLAGSLLAAPLTVNAQQVAGMPRVGHLVIAGSTSTQQPPMENWNAFLAGLGDEG